MYENDYKIPITYMQDFFTDYTGEMVYQMRFGELKKKDIFKKITLMVIPFFAVVVLMGLAIDSVSTLTTVIIGLIGSVVIGVFYVMNLYKTIKMICKIRHNEGLSDNRTRKLIFSKNGVEFYTPYSRTYVPYSDIENVISERALFIIKIRGRDYSTIVIPKKGMDDRDRVSFDMVLTIMTKDNYHYYNY